MGFSDDIMQIVKYLPKERQTIMFSATMPAKIQQLSLIHISMCIRDRGDRLDTIIKMEPQDFLIMKGQQQTMTSPELKERCV